MNNIWIIYRIHAHGDKQKIQVIMEASYDTRPIVAQSGVEDFCKTANQNVEDEITDKEDFV